MIKRRSQLRRALGHGFFAFQQEKTAWRFLLRQPLRFRRRIFWTKARYVSGLRTAMPSATVRPEQCDRFAFRHRAFIEGSRLVLHSDDPDFRFVSLSRRQCLDQATARWGYDCLDFGMAAAASLIQETCRR